MIHPSYTELIDKINAGVEMGEEPIVQSRYSIVIAAAKRARQIVAGEEPRNNVSSEEVTKPLSQAIAELDEGVIHVLSDEEFEAAQAEIDAEYAALSAANEQVLDISEDEEEMEDTEEADETDGEMTEEVTDEEVSEE